jgi:hypothetical protein
MNSDTLLCQYE